MASELLTAHEENNPGIFLDKLVKDVLSIEDRAKFVALRLAYAHLMFNTGACDALHNIKQTAQGLEDKKYRGGA